MYGIFAVSLVPITFLLLIESLMFISVSVIVDIVIEAINRRGVRILNGGRMISSGGWGSIGSAMGS